MKVPLIDLQAQFKNIEPEIRVAIDEVLQSQKFILDSQVASLEKELASYTQTPYAITCASGTDALLLSLVALGVGEDDEVITTSYSFFATAGMISWLKAKPVFVDIDPGTWNLQPSLIADKITARTKAIIGVHLFGQCCRMEEITTFGIPVIEDAAQAIGSTRNGKPAGGLGEIACFSFFPTKNLGAFGDGGFITTVQEPVALRIRKLRAHGQGSHRYLHEMIGTNSRLDELQAAVLRVKLKYLDDWNARRIQNAIRYYEGLAGLPLTLPHIDEANRSNYHQFVIRTGKRDALKQYLTDHDIGSAIYYPLPLPHQPCFALLGYVSGDFPNAEACAAESLAIPIHPELTRAQQDHVIQTIRNFYH